MDANQKPRTQTPQTARQQAILLAEKLRSRIVGADDPIEAFRQAVRPPVPASARETIVTLADEGFQTVEIMAFLLAYKDVEVTEQAVRQVIDEAHGKAVTSQRVRFGRAAAAVVQEPDGGVTTPTSTSARTRTPAAAAVPASKPSRPPEISAADRAKKIWGRPPLAEYAAAGGRKNVLTPIVTRVPPGLQEWMRMISVHPAFPYGSLVNLHRAAVTEFLSQRPDDAPGFQYARSRATGSPHAGGGFIQVNAFLPNALKPRLEAHSETCGESMSSLLLTVFAWYINKYHAPKRKPGAAPARPEPSSGQLAPKRRMAP